ncbi:MAG TPA: nickel pincer cofactor biosynthesis protein LarC [Verrucomicrobiota bacterium]|nr:nickel pincer cofactor biosynthesis protein LarC [Verrucomicrobiota bacterium]
MKTLYLDIFSGISGDMFLGAMIDLGVDATVLETELAKLNLDDYQLHVGRKTKANIEGVKFDVHLLPTGGEGEGDHHEQSHGHSHEHGHSHSHSHDDNGHSHNRTFADIRSLINSSALSDWVKEKSVAVFRRVAEAEGKVHGMPPDEVHFHEVGAVDSIVDIVGGCIALELLGKPRVLAAPITEGTGWVECAHGHFPVPTAATLEILGARGVAVNQCDEPHELVTPTGAALLAEFAESFELMHGVTPERIGYGLGTRDMNTRPNVLRAVLGQAEAATGAKPLDWERDTVTVIETNLDDINAEHLGHFVEIALETGALDVFHTSIQMKKNRPGVLLTVLCTETDADRFSELILRETTALGIRRHATDRRKLRREVVTVETPLGQVRVKLGRLNGEVVQAAPEYESCRKVADQAGVPLKAVYAAAQKALEN